ncbi:MAG: 3'-5' exonuclease [Rubrivivax sp.]|nr:3'-5' exonuclease [Rubrivivax sp.]
MAALIDTFRKWLGPAAARDDDRWVVLDVESSGLDPHRDRLLAIAAIGVRAGPQRALIELGDSFEVVLRQAQEASATDKANILLHGIGIGAQRAGMVRRAALQAFADFVGDSPLIAFHAAFDRTLIDRAFRREFGWVLRNRWLDLEPLAAVLEPRASARSLDEWMAQFGIQCAVRHQAAADTLATAELLLKLWPALRAELPRPGFRAVASLAAQRRWVQG